MLAQRDANANSNFYRDPPGNQFQTSPANLTDSKLSCTYHFAPDAVVMGAHAVPCVNPVRDSSPVEDSKYDWKRTHTFRIFHSQLLHALLYDVVQALRPSTLLNESYRASFYSGFRSFPEDLL